MDRLSDLAVTKPALAAIIVLALCVLCLLIFRVLRYSALSNRPVGSECRPDEPFEGQATAKITSLRVYPVKSCAGVTVMQAKLGERGLAMDRLWLIVDGNGRFLSQRRCPKLAHITPSLPKHENEALVLTAPEMPSIEVPVMRRVGPSGPMGGGEEVEVRIWTDTCRAVDQGLAVASWLRTVLDMDDVRMVRMKDGFVRPTDPDYGIGFHTGFSDGFPLLLAAEESLEELNSRLPIGKAIGMERFRPNVIVRGWGAFAEDEWTKVSIGQIPMRMAKPCKRCKVPTINQRTLEAGVEPTSTMETFRTGSHLGLRNPSWANGVFFGVNTLAERCGVLRAGDKVEVLRVAQRLPPPKKDGENDLVRPKVD